MFQIVDFIHSFLNLWIWIVRYKSWGRWRIVSNSIIHGLRCRTHAYVNSIFVIDIGIHDPNII